MVNVIFNVGSVRTRPFTVNQMKKIEEGIAIFNQIVNSSTFRKRVTNYSWRTDNGTTYNRFHMSNGMSNDQVWDCIEQGFNRPVPATKKNNTSWVMNIMPCFSVNDIMWNRGWVNPTVWMDVNCMDQEWYTPVHVACCLVHECCVNMGFCADYNGQRVEYWRHTVPYACATICCDIICDMAKSNTTWKAWCSHIDSAQFDYCPCSYTYAAQGTTSWCMSPCARIDEVITWLNTEVQWIEDCNKPTTDEVNRMTTLTNTINSLREMKSKLFVTSLDGCERVGIPHTEMTTVVTP